MHILNMSVGPYVTNKSDRISSYRSKPCTKFSVAKKYKNMATLQKACRTIKAKFDIVVPNMKDF